MAAMEDHEVEVALICDEDTRQLGRRIAACLRPGDVVLLDGELGAGKTTLVQGLAEALGAPGQATSPTFALCHRYATSPPLAHVDCWRMERPSELDDLALDELLEDGYVLVAEWGDRLRPWFEKEALSVELSRIPPGRLARLSTLALRWADELTALAGSTGERPC